MNVTLGSLASEIQENIGLQALIGNAVSGIQNLPIETEAVRPGGFHVVDTPAPTSQTDLNQLLQQDELTRAQQTIHHHINDHLTGSEAKQDPYPKLESVGILSEEMHGISRSKEGSKPLVITYSFDKNNRLKEYELSAHKEDVEISTYQPFSEEEKRMMRETFDQFEAAANVKYVEVSNPADAYLAIGKYDLSKDKNIHYGQDVGTGGFASFPNQRGGYLVLTTTSPVNKGTLIHELMHTHGAAHTHESDEIDFYQEQFDTHNASTMAYGYNRKGTPDDSWIGGNSHRLMGRAARPETLQTLDLE